MGKVPSYTQGDIVDYFERLRREDKERPPEKRESQSTQIHRLAALKFLTNDCHGLTINFKVCKSKGAR